MIEELIRKLESKGLKDVRSIVEELVKGGALTPFDASKYLARDKVLTIVTKQSISTTCIIGDVAYEYRMGKETLKRVMG